MTEPRLQPLPAVSAAGPAGRAVGLSAPEEMNVIAAIRLSSAPLGVAVAAIVIAATLLTGCRPPQQAPEAPRAVADSRHVNIVAFLDPACPSRQPTVELLHELEREHPERLRVGLVDIETRSGRQRMQEAEMERCGLLIEGASTVSWGEGDDRRLVRFVHPAGFSWTHKDLCEAVEAALEGRLHAAQPEEAEGIRILDASVRAQSIRVGDRAEETGQLMIDDEVVLEVTRSRDDLAPGQRVTSAAAVLTEALGEPFTPDELRTEAVEEGVAVLAHDRPLLVATEADARAGDTEPAQLARSWCRSLQEAFMMAAIERDRSDDEATT